MNEMSSSHHAANLISHGKSPLNHASNAEETKSKQRNLNTRTASNSIEIADRVYAKYPENDEYYWGLVTKKYTERRKTLYNITFDDRDKAKGVSLGKGKKNIYNIERWHKHALNFVDPAPPPPMPEHLVKAQQKLWDGTYESSSEESLSNDESDDNEDNIDSADPQEIPSMKQSGPSRCLEQRPQIVAPQAASSVEETHHQRCGKCRLCILPECGNCHNCKNASQEPHQSQGERVCLLKMCLEIPRAQKQQKLVGFPPGWSFSIEDDVSEALRQGSDIVPGLFFIPPPNCFSPREYFESFREAKNHAQMLNYGFKFEEDVFFDLLGFPPAKADDMEKCDADEFMTSPSIGVEEGSHQGIMDLNFHGDEQNSEGAPEPEIGGATPFLEAKDDLLPEEESASCCSQLSLSLELQGPDEATADRDTNNHLSSKANEDVCNQPPSSIGTTRKPNDEGHDEATADSHANNHTASTVNTGGCNQPPPSIIITTGLKDDSSAEENQVGCDQPPSPIAIATTANDDNEGGGTQSLVGRKFVFDWLDSNYKKHQRRGIIVEDTRYDTVTAKYETPDGHAEFCWERPTAVGACMRHTRIPGESTRNFFLEWEVPETIECGRSEEMRPHLSLTYKGFCLKFTVLKSTINGAELGLFMKCSPLPPNSESQLILKKGELLDIGVCAPLRDEDTIDEDLFFVKNFIHHHRPEKYCFNDGANDKNQLDITDITGQVHDLAQSRIHVYANKCDLHDTRQNICAENDMDGRWHYMLGTRTKPELVIKADDEYMELFVGCEDFDEDIRAGEGSSASGKDVLPAQRQQQQMHNNADLETLRVIYDCFNLEDILNTVKYLTKDIDLFWEKNDDAAKERLVVVAVVLHQRTSCFVPNQKRLAKELVKVEVDLEEKGEEVEDFCEMVIGKTGNKLWLAASKHKKSPDKLLECIVVPFFERQNLSRQEFEFWSE